MILFMLQERLALTIKNNYNKTPGFIFRRIKLVFTTFKQYPRMQIACANKEKRLTFSCKSFI